MVTLLYFASQDRVKFPFRQTCPTKSLSNGSRSQVPPLVEGRLADTIHTCSATMKTTWKEIPPVPTSQEFLDVVLSRTQRRLPTQIRSGFQISRIRNFYTRKVKYTQETFTEKLSLILGLSDYLNFNGGIAINKRQTVFPGFKTYILSTRIC